VTFSFVDNDNNQVVIQKCLKIYGIKATRIYDGRTGGVELALGYLPTRDAHLFNKNDRREMASSILGLQGSSPRVLELKLDETKDIICNPSVTINSGNPIDITPCITVFNGKHNIHEYQFTLIYK
jgi:hypothetical protein